MQSSYQSNWIAPWILGLIAEAEEVTAAIARCLTVEDVIYTVRWTRSQGLSLWVRGIGHGNPCKRNHLRGLRSCCCDRSCLDEIRFKYLVVLH